MELIPVFNIERFAIHDGEGIRTTIFIQGCPLRCIWCANPESQKIGPKLMFLQQKCTACGECVRVCPHHAAEIQNGRKIIDRSKCTVCGNCVSACPAEALSISGKWMSAQEIFDEIIRDKDYYDDSNGGITISGGEPLGHIRYLIPLLKRCHEAKINIAAETSGHVPYQNFVLAEQWVDSFLFDIKTVDAALFKKLTGGTLSLVLENFRLLASLYPERITARVPVIPGLNYSEGALRAIFDFVRSNQVRRLDLLPYHTLGLTKYRQLDMPYQMKDIHSLHKTDLIPYQNIGRDMGLDVRIGG